jgi:type IV secretory pathway VirB4 component
MTRRRTRLRHEGSLLDRVAAGAADRDRERAAAALRREQRAVARLEDRYLGPPGVDGRGGFGRAAGRVYWRLRIPPLSTTAAQLCSIYPFVCDPGLPADGPLVGMEVYSRSGFTFSVHELYRAKIITAPNMVVTGEIGSAKSSLLKCLAFRGVPFGTRFYITDVKGEYDELGARAGVAPVRIGPGLGVIMNPLAGIRRDPQMTVEQWLQMQRSRRLLLLEGLLEIQLGDRLVEAERSLIEYAVDAVTRTDDATSPDRMPTPTLGAVLAGMADTALWRHRLDAVSYDVDQFVADSRRVRLALERLISGAIGGLFDGPVSSSVRLDFDEPGAILDLRAVRTSDQMTAMAMTCAQSWLEAELSRPDAPPRVCFYDEFALIARHLPLVRRMREQLKLARALGIANVLAFHRFSDLAASGSADSEQVSIARGLIEDSGVRISYRQATGSIEQAREFLGTTDVETDLLRYLRQGVGLWKIGNRSFVVKHQLSTVEERMVHTDSRMEFVPGVDDLTDDDYEARLEAASTGRVAA